MVSLDAPETQRGAAVAGVVAALIWIVPTFLAFGGVDESASLRLAAILTIGLPVVLTVGSLAGIHGRFRRSYGWSGRVALGAFVAGLLMYGVGGVLLFEYLELLLSEPALGDLPIGFWITMFLLGIGVVLDAFGGAAYGIVLWRRDLGPRLGAGLLVARVLTVVGGTAFAASVFGVKTSTVDALFTHVGLGVALLAYAHFMWTTPTTPVNQ